MTHVIVYHHEHAHDDEPSSERILGPMTLDEAKGHLARLCVFINEGRDKEQSGHWEVTGDGEYLGMGEEDQERLGFPDISSAVWACVQPLVEVWW